MAVTQPKCEQCGGPADAGRVQVGFTSDRRLFVCGPGCLEARHRTERAQRRCIGFECNQRFTPEANGRPQLYHDHACRSRTDRAIASGLRTVATSKVPRKLADLEYAVNAVQFTRCCWNVKEAREFGRPFPTLPTPEPAMARASALHLSKLSQALVSARAEAAREVSQKAEAERQKAAQRAADERERADQGWRKRVLAALGDEEAEA